MDIGVLKAFVAIMKSGSYSIASQELFLTQSAISKRIAKLEGLLGVRLFVQQARNIVPTSRAHELLPYARNMILSYKNMKDAMNEGTDHPSIVNIGTTLFATLNYLIPLIQYFKKLDFPFQINYRQIEHKEISDYLDNCSLDLVISVKNLAKEPDFECNNLWDEYFYCIVNPDHPLSNEHEVSLDRLFSYPAVLTETGFPIRDRLEHLALLSGIKPEIQVMSSSFLVLQQLVREGVGWTILPEPLCSPDLKRVQCPNLFSTIPVCLYTHKEHMKSNTIGLLHKSLLEWPRLYPI